MQNINKKRVLTNEFLFVLYFCMFSFLKPLTVNAGGLSKVILLSFTLLILLAYMTYNRLFFDLSRFLSLTVMLSFIALAFAFDTVFRGNSVIYQNLYHFIIYGMVPLFLLINVKDYKKLLWWWCTLTLLAGLLFVADPFFGYRLSGGYMPFGFNHMLPAFLSSIVLFLYYRRKWAIIPAIVLFVELLMYSNKGSVLTAGIFCLLFFLFLRKQQNKRIFHIILIILVIAVVLYLLRFVLFDLVYDFAKSIGVDSYSLRTFREMLYVSTDRIFSMRTDIWAICLEELKQNLFLGIGVGSFQARYGFYPHNIFFDIFVSSGIFATFVFIILLIKSIFDLKKYNKDKTVFLFVILILWLFPMQISLNMWSYAPFWIYWGVWVSSCRIEQKSRTAIS